MNDVAMTIVYDDKIREMIKRHEGYNSNVYEDSVGVITGGYGHALWYPKTKRGTMLPKGIWEEVFNLDTSFAFRDANKIIEQLSLKDIGEARRAVIVNMIFNLGTEGFLGFHGTLDAIAKGDFQSAKEHMLNSLWARQVGKRAIELAEIMATGVMK